MPFLCYCSIPRLVLNTKPPSASLPISWVEHPLQRQFIQVTKSVAHIETWLQKLFNKNGDEIDGTTFWNLVLNVAIEAKSSILVKHSRKTKCVFGSMTKFDIECIDFVKLIMAKIELNWRYSDLCFDTLMSKWTIN